MPNWNEGITWLQGDWSNESLYEYFKNNDDEDNDLEYPKQTLQCIALALVRLCYAVESIERTFKRR